jgi:polysaccharide biosynthesis protein PslE
MLTPQQIHDLVRYFRRSLERNWRLAAGVAGGVMAVTMVSVLFLPKAYFSEARLFVRFGRENLMLDPTATTGQMISIYESRENEINSLLEVLKSRAMLDRLVESLGPEYILWGGEPKPFAPRPAATSGDLAAGTQSRAPITPTAAHQAAAAYLEKSIEVWAPRKSNIISVQCKSSSPAIAQQITARLVEIYLDEYVHVHRTAGSYEFFADQTKVANEEWQAAAGRLGAAKNKLGIVTIDGKKKQLQDEITDIDAKLLANRSDLKTAEARIESLQALIADLPEKIVTQEAQAANAAFDNMRGTLFQLEAREQELAATRNDSHPQLVAIRQQISDLRNVLREQPTQRIQTTEAVNPARQSLELNLLTEQSQVDALTGREKSLASLQTKLRGDLKQLNSQEATLGQLQQDVDLAESRYKAYADKLEQARINRSLDDERISSLTVVQPASYPTKPSGPRKMYVLALGMIMAAVSGFGAAMIAAYFQPLVISPLDIERLLDLPLVGVLPAVRDSALLPS